MVMKRQRKIYIDEEPYFYDLSFDITNEYIGEGIWWLQIYDCEKQMIWDRPFASGLYEFGEKDVINGAKEGLELLRLL